MESINVPNFKTQEEFVEYLELTLIPDLQKSNMHATAADFEEAVYWLSQK